MENKQILYICLGIGVLIIILIIGFILYRKKEKFTDNYLTYVMTTNGIQEVDGTLNPYTVIKSFPLQNNISSALVTSDGAHGTATFYTVNTDFTISVYQNGLGILSLPAPSITGYTLSTCQYITTDTLGTLYVAGLMYTTSSSSTQPFIQQYTRKDVNTWTQDMVYTAVSQSNPTVNVINCSIQTVIAFAGEVIIYFAQADNSVCGWLAFAKNTTSLLGYGIGGVDNTTATTCSSIVDSKYIYRCDNEGTLTATTTDKVTYNYSKLFKNIVDFVGFDQNGYLLVSTNNSDYQAINITSGAQVYSFTPSPNVLRIQVGSQLIPGQFIPDEGADGAVCVDDNGNISLTAAIPVGSIVMWSSNSPPPTGWLICDGSKGTPNLQGQFIKGTTDPSRADSDVTNTGGSANVTLFPENVPSHSHMIYIGQSTNSWANSLPLGPPLNTFVNGGGGTTYTAAINAPTDIGGLSYTPTAISIMPPYYTIYFIMKME